MTTIIEVNQGQYTENIAITKTNIKEALKEIKGKDWTYIVKGDITLEPKEVTVEFETSTPMSGLLSADGRLKVFFDTFSGEWRHAFQTIKSTDKGEFITIYGRRIYISDIIEK
jgi:copper chaperone CopZ